MKTKILPFLLFIFFLSETTSGQEKVDTINSTKYEHALGAGVGGTIGYGLAYRFMPNDFGLLTTFAPFNDEYETIISFGVTFLYQLIETDNTNFFIYQGNQYLYKEYKNRYYTYEKVNNIFNHGLGFGVEIVILKRISFNIMGGYSSYDNFERIGFTGETGLFYRF